MSKELLTAKVYMALAEAFNGTLHNIDKVKEIDYDVFIRYNIAAKQSNRTYDEFISDIGGHHDPNTNKIFLNFRNANPWVVLHELGHRLHWHLFPDVCGNLTGYQKEALANSVAWSVYWHLDMLDDINPNMFAYPVIMDYINNVKPGIMKLDKDHKFRKMVRACTQHMVQELKNIIKKEV